MNDIVIKFIKYCIVGFSGMAIDFSTTWVLKEKLSINKYIANSVGFFLAATANYILNKIWTFSNTDNHIVTQYFLFFSISVCGLILNNIVIYFLADKLRWNFYLSKIIATIIVTIWNFCMNYLFTFS